MACKSATLMSPGNMDKVGPRTPNQGAKTPAGHNIPSNSRSRLTCEDNSAKCPRSFPSLPDSPLPSTPQSTTYHGASLIRPNSGSRKSPTPRRAAREKRAKERGKNSVIYLTLFINFPFLALVTRRRQRSLARSLARLRDPP